MDRVRVYYDAFGKTLTSGSVTRTQKRPVKKRTTIRCSCGVSCLPTRKAKDELDYASIGAGLDALEEARGTWQARGYLISIRRALSLRSQS